MSFAYQLRVDHPEKALRIYDLDEVKGITTLGREPPNDILLPGSRAAPFQLVLDYRQQPCLTVTGRAEPVTVNDRAVPPGQSLSIQDEDVIRVAGYILTFRMYPEEPIAAQEAPASELEPEPDLLPAEAPPPPATPDRPGAPSAEPETAAGATGGPLPDRTAIPALDRAEPAIVASIPEQEQVWTIDVGQTILLQLTVINGGELVAEFHVAAEGVPPEWVTIAPPEFNLNERAHSTVTVTVTPPRLPTSRAGTHRLTLVVTSPTYPHERSQTSATLTIRPYYELAVGNLSPKRQAIAWSQAAGQITIPLTNKSNSGVLVGLAGEDDAQACRFEFKIPDEMDDAVALARQVDLRVPLDRTVGVPVELVPKSRPLVGRGGRLIDVRPRVHPYTITVTVPEGQQGPLTLYGEWQNAPRFSRRVLLATTLAVILLWLALTVAIFYPRINSLDASSSSIRAGQVVELDWTAWPPFLVSFKLDGQSVRAPVSVRPKETTTYELRADTWLSHLWPAWSATAPQTIEVRPVKPDILLFEAAPTQIARGQSVVLSWVVDDADELVLIDQAAGVKETLVVPCGSREVVLDKGPARYTLQAIGADGAVVERALAVTVASPVISIFSVNPTAITSATEVELAWSVPGAAEDQISLTRSSFKKAGNRFVTEPVEFHGTQSTTKVTVDSTTVFSLSVSNGTTKTVQTARVKVLKPTPLPVSAPAVAPAPAPPAGPGVIVVYTALSQDELEAMGAVPAEGLARILDDLGAQRLDLSRSQMATIRATQPAEVSNVVASLNGADVSRDDLSTFNYVHVVTPTNAAPIRLLIVRDSTQDLVRRLLAEQESPRADVIWMVAATDMIRLRAEGLLEPLAGLYRPTGLENVKAGWRDPSLPPEWLGLTAWQAAFCVNEAKLDGAPAPTSWADLTKPIYRGKIAMPSPYASGTGYMVVAGLLHEDPFGEAGGWWTMDRLHENIALYTASGNQPCKLAGPGGDAHVAIGIAANICSSESGPATTLYPKQGSGWEMDTVALVRKDKIGQNAVAFVAWTISREAMAEYAQFRAGFSHVGFSPEKTCFEGFDESQIVPDRLLWAGASYARVTEKWLSRYGSEADLLKLESIR